MSDTKRSFFKSQLFSHIIVALISGLSVLGGNYMLSESNTNASNYETDNKTIVSLIGKVSELQEQVQELQIENGELRTRAVALQNRVNQLENIKAFDEFAVSSFFKYMPIPAWLKVYDKETDQFIMRRINRAYEDQWNVLSIRYAGKPDNLIWDLETAKLFKHNDEVVRNQLSPIITIETIPDTAGVVRDENETDWIISKFPVSFNGVEYNAVGGIAIPDNIKDLVEFP